MQRQIAFVAGLGRSVLFLYGKFCRHIIAIIKARCQLMFADGKRLQYAGCSSMMTLPSLPLFAIQFVLPGVFSELTFRLL